MREDVTVLGENAVKKYSPENQCYYYEIKLAFRTTNQSNALLNQTYSVYPLQEDTACCAFTKLEKWYDLMQKSNHPILAKDYVFLR